MAALDPVETGFPAGKAACPGLLRRGGRVVECTALEMRRAREGTQGSNPCLSANIPFKPLLS
jgi:hypothetical protein